MISGLQKGAQMRPDTLSPPVIPSHTCPVQPRRTPHQRSQSLRLQAQKQANKAEEDQTAFKWDPSNARWKRVNTAKDPSGKYATDKWIEGGGATIKTRTGGEYTVWPVIHGQLMQRGLKSIKPQEAYDLVQKGKAVMVDVRAAWNYENEHIEGAVSMPLFRGVEGKTPWDTAKRLVMTIGFAMKATERDPEFRQKAKQRLDAKKTLIPYCSLGGTIKVGAQPWGPGRKSFPGDPERQFGRESRSLKGCFELQEAGFKNVMHLEGGISQWRHEGFPTE